MFRKTLEKAPESLIRWISAGAKTGLMICGHKEEHILTWNITLDISRSRMGGPTEHGTNLPTNNNMRVESTNTFYLHYIFKVSVSGTVAWQLPKMLKLESPFTSPFFYQILLGCFTLFSHELMTGPDISYMDSPPENKFPKQTSVFHLIHFS